MMAWFEAFCLVALLVVALLSFVLSRKRMVETEVVNPAPVVDPYLGIEEACDAIAARYELTNREREVLAFLGRGRTAAHITQELVLSENTVRTHTRHIYRKMGINSQQELIDIVEAEMRGGASE